MNKFAVGKLLDMGDRHFDDRAQIAGEGRPEIPPEPFMQAFQRPHLVFADPFGPFEVVDLNIKLRFPLRPENRRRATSLAAACAAIHRRQQRIDFRLIQNVSSTPTASMPRNPIVHYRTFPPNSYTHPHV